MSSGSDSDDDYKPGEPENLSEEDSADEDTDLQFEKELEHKTKKRKATTETTGKKKTRTNVMEKKDTEKKEVEVPEQKSNSTEEKKREEDLWAKFLEGTDTKPKPASNKSNVTSNPTNSTTDITKVNCVTNNINQNREDEKARESRIFEFAGETIVVENNVIKERTKATESPASVSKPSPFRGRGSGGLSSVLSQMNQKNKLSTLEKSKLDWNTFKKVEGIEEEIESHNKGKDGYLDRQDFLERADLRQYEIERDLKMNRRSNR